MWRHSRGKAVDPEWAKIVQEFLESGAQTGFIERFNSIEERARALEREINQSGPRNWMGVKQTLNLVSDYNTAIENASRLAVFAMAREKGLSTIRAANLAKGITVNFNRRGASTGALASAYMFFNAGAQSTARMIETLKSPAGKRVAALLVGIGIASGKRQHNGRRQRAAAAVHRPLQRPVRQTRPVARRCPSACGDERRGAPHGHLRTLPAAAIQIPVLPIPGAALPRTDQRTPPTPCARRPSSSATMAATTPSCCSTKTSPCPIASSSDTICPRASPTTKRSTSEWIRPRPNRPKKPS
jgi:hypothetical protein